MKESTKIQLLKDFFISMGYKQKNSTQLVSGPDVVMFSNRYVEHWHFGDGIFELIAKIRISLKEESIVEMFSESGALPQKVAI